MYQNIKFYCQFFFFSKFMMQIQPEEEPLYEWKFVDSLDKATVTFTLPNGLEVFDIHFTEYNDKQSILVETQFKIPYLCGMLPSTYSSIDAQMIDNNYIVTINKSEKKEWPRLIIAKNKYIFSIDPKSALLLYKDTLTNKNSNYSAAMEMLEFSAFSFFLPAVRECALVYLKNRETQNSAFQLLQIGTDKYQDPSCAYQLGLILSTVQNMKKKAFGYMKFAAEKGISDAMAALGEFYSSLSNLEYSEKDAQQALIWLNKANETQDNWVACHELAKLYLSGTGIEKDIEKAKNFQLRARVINPKCPELSFDETSEESSDAKPASQILFGSAALAAIAGFGFVVYRSLRRK